LKKIVLRITKAIQFRLFYHTKKYLLHDGRNVRQVLVLKGSLRKLLIIAPGESVIPGKGWGAVEYIVMKHADLLNKLGFEVIILNSWHHRDWFKALKLRPSFVILHYDMFSVRWNIYRKFLYIPTLVISHYGFAAFPDRWNKTYRRSLKHFTKFEYIGCLSQGIKEVFQSQFPHANFVLTPNGTEIEDFSKPLPDLYNKFILLGKVEDRKRQVAISLVLQNQKLIDFVGPIQDPSFFDLPVESQKQYLGEWDREKINIELPKYRGLILLSDAEADALVLHEALSAGIEVFVSPNAIGSQKKSEWVHLIDDIEDLETVLVACLNRERVSRDLIRADAAQRSWEVRINEISKLILNSP
jgi:hypothetical protein